MAYVELAKELGSTFVEKHISAFCTHVLDLAAKCGAAGFNK